MPGNPTDRLLERLLILTATSERFLAIVGTSGSGNLSLMHAGLVPALRWHPISANWPINILTSTTHTLESLAMSLTGTNSPPASTAALITTWPASRAAWA